MQHITHTLRPISPHLTIYSWQITMIMSILHRATGLALSGAVGGLILCAEFYQLHLTNYTLYTLINSYLIEYLDLILFLVIMSSYYHLLNGLRHLAWDAGLGLDIKTLYFSGYAVCGLTVVLSAGTWLLL